ncbi:MAG: hypothetical protein ACYTGX_11655 [Planctomycetota bacterium]|jgi:hypothetical protein
MTLYCPGCNTAVDGSAAVGLHEMHCPACGIRFAVPEQSADAARWGEVTTSKLAVIALLSGIGSLVLPFCLCPFLIIGVAGTTAATTAPPMPVRTVPAMPAPATAAQPVPGDLDAEEEEDGAEEGAEEGDDE